MDRLQSISKVRRIKEQEKEVLNAGISRLRESLEQERQCLLRLERSFAEEVAAYEKRVGADRLNAAELQIRCDHIFWLSDRIDGQRERIELISEDIRGLQEMLTGLHREDKALGILQERIAEEMARQEMRSEQKDMDSISLQKRRPHQ